MRRALLFAALALSSCVHRTPSWEDWGKERQERAEEISRLWMHEMRQAAYIEELKRRIRALEERRCSE